MSTTGFDTSRRAWISRGFEQLVHRVRRSPHDVHFDVLIVGSGYGGAMAAQTFAGRTTGSGRPLAVGVLERGSEYLPGAFPANLAELPKHVRMERQKEGLFDIRLGPEVVTVLASGVGGGSLINAGVMEVPSEEIFAAGWPAVLSAASTWRSYYDRARELLGASKGGVANTIAHHPQGPPKKFAAIEAAASSAKFRRAALTVAMTDGVVTSGNVELNGCRRCGDCATGCNHGAKNSLDVSLLVRAHRRGAAVFSGATVLRLERDVAADAWIVHAVHTNATLRARAGGTVAVRARRIVLAAGTLGSAEILLRSRGSTLQLSSRLGQRVSTNGDMLIVDYDRRSEVGAVADPAAKPSTRAVGPTITGIADLRATAALVVEEIAVPAALRGVFGEVFATVHALHSLETRDRERHTRGFPADDIYSVPAERMDRSAIFAVMGDDGAAGTIELAGEPTDERDGIGRIRWEGLQYQALFDRQVETVRELTAESGGRVLPNPFWKLLPAQMSWLLDGERGPLTTVHPLGGCVMGDSVEEAVVDDCGRVFDASAEPGGVHDGLVVLDGAIVPTALCTNPALTIAALALRASEALADDWGYALPGASAAEPAATEPRPPFRRTDAGYVPAETEVELIERLAGPVEFRAAGGSRDRRIVELTLRFEPKSVLDLARAPHDGRRAVLTVAGRCGDAATASRIRVYDEATWQQANLEHVPAGQMEQRLDAIALFDAPLSGSLTVLERQPTRHWPRTLRAGAAYLANRGLRDIWQAVFDGDGGPGFWCRLKGGLALASRAGEVRAFVYDLQVGQAESGGQLALTGSRIVGRKRFTYARRANPWRQLMEIRLDEFPGLGGRTRVLTLDPRYLARIGVPLIRVTKQSDGATALADLLSFGCFIVRLLLGVHIWSFRSPDERKKIRNREVLPGAMPGLPAPEIHNLYIGDEAPAGGGDKVPVHVRLTRYRRPSSAKNPILMIHGYSAGGTTFAHRSVRPNFAHYFWGEPQSRDVWIVDMRTSSGMPAATLPWSFEQVGYRDVPAAVAHIAATTGRKVDVIAHCMGAVVFSMGLLHANELKAEDETVQQMLARRGLKERINRVVFTQVGPLVVLSPANVFRGYVLSYLKRFLPDRY
ncbi:MAG: GMC family oxidoreductase N-terminal domain-containing protein, partial [Gammaproteobacteria bacterium]|nr:GMC family oxidoreductase N-terminal domain-containing protein [Gammaproteobacteria bacterium]